VLGKKGAYLIGGTMCGQTPEELAAEASDRPTTKTEPESSSFSRLLICRSHPKNLFIEVLVLSARSFAATRNWTSS